MEKFRKKNQSLKFKVVLFELEALFIKVCFIIVDNEPISPPGLCLFLLFQHKVTGGIALLPWRGC